jgi:hypothetical protein
MEPALEGTEPTPFAEPAFWPEWKPFTRGQYALTYDPNATESESTETETTPAPRDRAPSPTLERGRQ